MGGSIRPRARQASLRRNWQRRKRVWQSYCTANNAPVQRRISIPEKSSAGSADESRCRISLPDEQRPSIKER